MVGRDSLAQRSRVLSETWSFCRAYFSITHLKEQPKVGVGGEGERAGDGDDISTVEAASFGHRPFLGRISWLLPHRAPPPCAAFGR